VVGVTSSGKSTLAEKLSRRFDLSYIELDALNWEPNWQAAPLEVFHARVEKATQAEGWIVPGNYHIVRDLIWPKAEAIIWLDYPLSTVLWQLRRRTFRRWWNQELLWGTSKENQPICAPSAARFKRASESATLSCNGFDPKCSQNQPHHTGEKAKSQPNETCVVESESAIQVR
jgi:hypothetical protein